MKLKEIIATTIIVSSMNLFSQNTKIVRDTIIHQYEINNQDTIKHKIIELKHNKERTRAITVKEFYNHKIINESYLEDTDNTQEWNGWDILIDTKYLNNKTITLTSYGRKNEKNTITTTQNNKTKTIKYKNKKYEETLHKYWIIR